MRPLLLSLAILLCATVGASAQSNRSALQQFNDANINANGRGLITGPIANTMNSDFISSFGVLNDNNSWLGKNDFLNSAPSVPVTGLLQGNGGGNPITAFPLGFNVPNGIPLLDGLGNATSFKVLPNGAGTVARSLGALSSDSINVKNYGATGAGIVNDGSYIQAAMTQASPGGEIDIPCGVYKITQNLSMTLANLAHLSVVGGGADCTELWFSGPYGMTVTWGGLWGSVNFSGMTITTDQINAGTGLSLIEPFASTYQVNEFGTNNIYDVSFRGHDRFSNPSPTEYWGTSFYESGLTLLNFFGGSCNNLPATPAGICYSVNGPPPAVTGLQSVEINFLGTSAANCGTGWFYGENSQGLALTSVNGTFCGYGVNTTTSTSGPDQLSISQSQFNTTICGVCINEDGIASILISNDSFIVEANSIGIQLQGVGNVVTDNSISAVSPTGTVGIAIAGSSPNAGGNLIASNSIGGFGTGIQLTNAAVPAYAYANYNNMALNTNDYAMVGSGAGFFILDNKGRNFSTFPTCSAANKWSVFLQADSSLTNGWGGLAAGGGSQSIHTICDGSAWRNS